MKKGELRNESVKVRERKARQEMGKGGIKGELAI